MYSKNYKKLTKERVKQVENEVKELDLPDGAHWEMCGERLGVEGWEVIDFMFKHKKYFGLTKRG